VVDGRTGEAAGDVVDRRPDGLERHQRLIRFGEGRVDVGD